jgi:hypothetical protein
LTKKERNGLNIPLIDGEEDQVRGTAKMQSTIIKITAEPCTVNTDSKEARTT